MSMMYKLRLAANDEIQGLLEDPDSIEDYLFDDESENQDLDLGKSWHGIHFLLTGSAWEGEEPNCFILTGGKEIGDIDVGYGPARALTGEQVEALFQVLEAIDKSEVAKRFNWEDFEKNEIYPRGWDNGSDEESVDWLLGNIDQLKEFLENAVKNSYGAIAWLE